MVIRLIYKDGDAFLKSVYILLTYYTTFCSKAEIPGEKHFDKLRTGIKRTWHVPIRKKKS